MRRRKGDSCVIMGIVASALFLLGAGFIAYCFAGYPLLLLGLGRWRPRPVRRGPVELTVSVIVPVRNGEQWIGRKLESLFALRYPRDLTEIIVAVDGATDGTAGIAQSYPRVKTLILPPGGKGATLNEALRHAQGEILLLTDVRQPLHQDCLTQLVGNFADPTVGVASGELVILSGELLEHARIGLYVRYEEWLRKQISKVGSVPGATGAIYAIRRKLAVPIPPDCLLDDVYLPMAAYLQGYRVVLDGTAIAYDYPTNISAEFRRKVRTLAGLIQLIGYYPWLLDPRKDIWLHFVSHKFARLLLPYAFLCVFVTSIFLPEPWGMPVFAGQCVFYLIALLDPVIPEGALLKRVSSLVRTFVMMLAASMAAGIIFFRPARTLWTERR